MKDLFGILPIRADFGRAASAFLRPRFRCAPRSLLGNLPSAMAEILGGQAPEFRVAGGTASWISCASTCPEVTAVAGAVGPPKSRDAINSMIKEIFK